MRVPLTLGALALALAALVAWLARSPAPDLNAPSGALHGAVGDSTRAGGPSSPSLEAQGDAHEGDRRAAQGTRARTITGRVLDERTRQGLADFGLTAGYDSAVFAEEVSDARGRFVLAIPPLVERVRVVVTAPFGWIAGDAPRELVCDSGGEFPELELLARPAGAGPLRLRLVDELTLEPVPHYLVRVGSRDGARAPATSDQHGLLTSEHELPEGLVLLFGYDVRHAQLARGEHTPHWYREFEHRPSDPGAPPIELAIPVGPTYRLELDAPREAPRESLAGLVQRSAPLFLSPQVLERGDIALVRAGDSYWLRFPPSVRRMASPGVLSILSFDGRWYGEGEVSTRRGVDPRTIALRLEPRSRLLGRSVDRAGAALANVDVTLFGPDRQAPLVELAHARAGGNGLFEFPFVPQGVYTLRGASLETAPAELELSVSGADDVEFEFALERTPANAALRGALLVPAALRAAQAVVVSARSLRRAGLEFEATIALAPGAGLRRAEFALEGVPPGEYELAAAADVDAGVWPVRASVEVVAPGPPVELELPDPSALRCVELRARDATSSEPVAGADLWLVGPTTLHALAPRGVGTSACFAAQPVRSGVWIAWAEGYAPRFGALDELSFSDSRAVLELELQRGWGARVEVLENDLTPAKGIDVLVDGESAGHTDARGIIALERSARPARIEFVRAGWRLDLPSRVLLRQVAAGDVPSARVWLSRD